MRHEKDSRPLCGYSPLKNVARTPRPSESQLETTDEASVLRLVQRAVITAENQPRFTGPDAKPGRTFLQSQVVARGSGVNGTAACRARVYGGHRGRAISAVLIFGGLVWVDSWEAGVAGVGAHRETSAVRGRGEAGVSVAGERRCSPVGRVRHRPAVGAGGVAVTPATVGLRSGGLGRRSGVR